MITDSRFWVFGWLAERGIDDSAGVARVLNDRSLYKELRLGAEQNGAMEAGKLAGTAPLVAGAGIDLTGAGACDSPLCIRKQVDVLFKHAWHYFDQIALTDLTPSIVDTPFGKVAETSLNGWLQALVYLRQIGAETMVEFFQSPLGLYCDTCLHELPAEVGLGGLITGLDDLVKQYKLNARVIGPQRVGNSANVLLEVTIPPLEAVHTFTKPATWLRNKTDGAIKHELVREVLEQEIWLLTGELRSAVLAEAPLGTTADLQKLLLQQAGRSQMPTADAVAFNIDLPVLEDVPVEVLLEIRRSEADLFRHFQASLRTAIDERLKGETEVNPAAIAREIQRDLIEPGLAEIRVALAKNANSMSRSAKWASVGTGVATVAVGAMLAHLQNSVLPVAAAAGITTACSAGLGSYLKARQDRDTLEIRPMYYIFKAIEHAEKHRSIV